ncbi:DUF974-domain-containing protein [Dentipellis sp. KUC8613]|nr:DUF974-domain-containing protein [Dentipellis sp. KUC8613]
MENPGHLLSLKVMRVSRPALASAWEPFYSSSPSLSAHSTASVLSLQGKTPLPGHPKTLRDLTNVTELLTLPSAFGAIQLGETFSGALAVNNETAVVVDGVTLRVEMQTATNKILLAELGGPAHSLAAGDTLETIVHHEIKELGQHVLACTVTYLLPPGARQPVSATVADPSADPDVQTFRKFYKFAVTNPLSVKTKVHTPRSPSALLDRTEREKVFLEVHIQNLTQDPMWFERVVLDPAQGWQAEDANVIQAASNTDGKGDSFSLFSGSMAMMQPQDTRQYLYILSATSIPSFPVHHAPGSVLPLGRLDISWRSQLGEPGRLLTSMLSRRIPLLPATQVQAPRQPASALPLHLQRSATVAAAPASHHSRPPSRSSTPPIGPVPYRPGSPFRNRPPSVPPARPQSPSSFTSAGAAISTPGSGSSIPLVPTTDTIDVDLAVRSIPRGTGAIRVDTPFTIACTLNVAAPVQPIPGRARVIALAVQHVQLPQPGQNVPISAGAPVVSDPTSPRVHALGTTTPTSASGTAISGPFSLLDDRTLVGSPRATTFEEAGIGLGAEGPRMLPPPTPTPGDEERYARTAGVKYVGPSTVFLPPLHLRPPRPTTIPDGESDDESAESVSVEDTKTLKAEGTWDVELVYMPTRSGFMAVGGLRVFLVEDRFEIVAESGHVLDAERRAPPMQKLREWDVIGEVWVDSH